MEMFRSGITLRWLNNAGFEMILPDGAHPLVGPRMKLRFIPILWKRWSGRIMYC